MRKSELGQAKACFQMMTLGTGISLINSLLPGSGSNSLLDGLLTLAAAVLTLIAIWRLRKVEYGYRKAFRVEVAGMVATVAGAVLVTWMAYAGAEGLAIGLTFLVAAIPVVSGGIFQYLFCRTTEQVMKEIGADQQALWSDWMWKIYAVYAAVALPGAILVLFQILPGSFSVALSWMGLAVNVLQIVYYFICSRALPTE